MKNSLLRTAALAIAATLAGCASGPGPGEAYRTEVTRFHLGGQFARGPISVEPIDPTQAGSLEFRAQAAAVSRELARLGWTVVPGVGQAEQVATVYIERGTREALARRSPVSVGVGGSTGSFGSGVGLGLGFNLGGNRDRGVVATMMEVRLKRRSDGTAFWEGRAIDEAPADDPTVGPAAIDRLTYALFRDFPGVSGETIRVE